jgi:hypothetical protein
MKLVHREDLIVRLGVEEVLLLFELLKAGGADVGLVRYLGGEGLEGR